MNWHDDSGVLDQVAIVALSNKELLPSACCNHPKIHIHAHSAGRWKEKGRGSAWIWCSHCGTFSHLDGIQISSDWENNPDVDSDQVSAVPIYLETVKDAVDKHMKAFLNK